MKKRFLPEIEILLAFLGFIIPIFLYQINLIDEKVLLGIWGSVASLFFGSLKLKIENDKFFKDLFSEFNSRYNVELNDLFNSLKFDPSKKIGDAERNQIIDYFNLCSEEFLWRKKNRIPKDVWNSWKSGMLENLSIPQVKELYLKEIVTENGRKSFYGLPEELKIIK